ncbi:MAG: MBL fold metallo-hydrolase [Piscinibacter sp.]|nr:MBL fold metallo-hydrolase [Piscinibacter sp.]
MRRLRPLLLLAAAALLAATGAAAAAPSAQPLTAGVRWLPGSFAPGRQPDGNSVLFDGPAGSVIVDTGRHVVHTQALLDALDGRPLLAVVNTHWHLDHLGGNLLLRRHRPQTRVWASDAVRPAIGGWLADSRRQMEAALASGQVDAATAAMMRIDLALIDAGDQLAPDVAVAAPGPLAAEGLALQLGLARSAVTAADLWVWDPRSRVLAAGDLVTLPVPFLDTACAPGWRAALAELDALPFETLVPGHGAPLDRAGFAGWRRAFGALLDCAASDAPAADCAARWATDLGPRWPADDARARGLLDHYLRDVLRAPPERRNRFCPAPSGR